MNSIIEKFRNKALERGGLFFFSGTDALLVIEEARQRRLAILGIDGIFLVGEKTQPRLDYSIDFTLDKKSERDVYKEAVEFVKRHANHELFFEIVFGPESRE